MFRWSIPQFWRSSLGRVEGNLQARNRQTNFAMHHCRNLWQTSGLIRGWDESICQSLQVLVSVCFSMGSVFMFTSFVFFIRYIQLVLTPDFGIRKRLWTFPFLQSPHQFLLVGHKLNESKQSRITLICLANECYRYIFTTQFLLNKNNRKVVKLLQK